MIFLHNHSDGRKVSKTPFCPFLRRECDEHCALFEYIGEDEKRPVLGYCGLTRAASFQRSLWPDKAVNSL